MLEKYMFTKVNLFLEGSLDGEIKSAIKSRAILGAIALAIPLPAISTIAYVLILWNTYSKIAEISTVPFRDHLWSNISGAVVINILIGIASEFLCWLFGVGTLMVLFLGYASISISGMAYVKALKVMYKDKATQDLNWKGGAKNVKNNPTQMDNQITKFLNK